ncbi:gamma-glutamylcyclotransferase family protein [Halalkalibacter alkalisediminis]|uniref:Gamma-glutamylcyclotransferase family protein n=1 Tax=Halalkalibacter alkalisediminis TaxID=935616 RepID=A0ABV6NG43_9BACI|nr:gamma-glutamylcyclotransferase family protein [Halalkalibacter alkalisediminis]
MSNKELEVPKEAKIDVNPTEGDKVILNYTLPNKNKSRVDNRKVSLFVYGTLVQGGSNHHFLRHATLISTPCWVYGELHDTGLGYPVLKKNQTKRVWGELYEVTKEQLKRIDQLEDYSPLNKLNEYIRVVQRVHTEKHTVDAYVYFAGEKLADCENLIEKGNWLHYLYDIGI